MAKKSVNKRVGGRRGVAVAEDSAGKTPIDSKSGQKSADTAWDSGAATKSAVKTGGLNSEEPTMSQETFKSYYKNLSLVMGVLAALGLLNFIMIFVVAWAVGSQLSASDPSAFGGRLASTEEKLEALIELLPPQYRPKLDLKVEAPDKQVDRWSGNKDNRYVLIKYSDLECPFCQAIQPELDKLIERNASELSLVFRNFPLTNIHPNARRLAETAECVAKTNGESAFWRFVNGVYTKTIPATVAGEEELAKYVENASQVTTCVTSGQGAAKVDRDIQDAFEATVSGTPTFILYDTQKKATKFVQNPGSADGLQQVFEDFKAKQQR